MASLSVASIADVFPAGTSVGAYPASGWPQASLPPSGAPPVSATNTGTVASGGALSITGLADATTYFLGASVSGTWRYRRAATAAAASSSGAETDPIAEADLATHAALTTGAHGLAALLAAKQATLTGTADVPGLAAALAAKVGIWMWTAVKTANYTAAVGEAVRCDPTGGAFTVKLPNAPVNGSRVAAKIMTATAPNIVTVQTQGSDVMNRTGGGTTRTLQTAGEAAIFEYDSANAIWTVIGSDTPVGALDTRYRTRTITTKTANYTLADTDTGAVIAVNSGSAVVITVPALAAGTEIMVLRQGAGSVTLAASGSTFVPADTRLTISTVGGMASVLGLGSSAVAKTGDLI